MTAPKLTATHYVYEFYNAAGECLYIGCTSRLGYRLTAHVYKPWWPQVAQIKVRAHDGYEAGSRAEQDRIRAENPRHNQVFTDHHSNAGGWETRRRHLRGELCDTPECGCCGRTRASRALVDA